MSAHRTWPVALLTAAAFAIFASSASADRVYHSEHVPLTAVGGAPLLNGFVENIHANGPNVFAREYYHLTGAAPATEYFVTLAVYAVVPAGQATPDCGGDIVFAADDASFTTNAAGNGTASSVIAPSVIDELGLHDTTLVARWFVTTGDFLDQEGSVAYISDCATPTLD